ncbi:MAG: hypothetical protein KGI00_02285 [Candidatus Micrarchaeota archaeon]|nr:hypothetical protein [Candidatus Micrarchaeota archaeon]MDE1823740.1 hypothetical protein [Candidatus Micrarchaeota archaeon]MDE1849537.1 hypothetical protein [Candidatus Micrarchaeota archaeon]
MICARCSRDIYKFYTCNYCKRKVCNDCIKSSRRISRVQRIFICKDDWSKMASRKLFKRTTKETV